MFSMGRNVANSSKTRHARAAEQVQSTCPSTARIAGLSCPQGQLRSASQGTNGHTPANAHRVQSHSRYLPFAFVLPQARCDAFATGACSICACSQWKASVFADTTLEQREKLFPRRREQHVRFGDGFAAVQRCDLASRQLRRAGPSSELVKRSN